MANGDNTQMRFHFALKRVLLGLIKHRNNLHFYNYLSRTSTFEHALYSERTLLVTLVSLVTALVTRMTRSQSCPSNSRLSNLISDSMSILCRNNANDDKS